MWSTVRHLRHTHTAHRTADVNLVCARPICVFLALVFFLVCFWQLRVLNTPISYTTFEQVNAQWARSNIFFSPSVSIARARSLSISSVIQKWRKSHRKNDNVQVEKKYSSQVLRALCYGHRP